MSNEELRNLKPGDEVMVLMESGSKRRHTVKYAPWQLGDGTWVIGLKGLAGGYLLSRVTRLVKKGG